MYSSHHPRQHPALTGKLWPRLCWRLSPSQGLPATETALKSQSCRFVCLNVYTLSHCIALSSGMTSCSIQTGPSVVDTVVQHPLASSRPGSHPLGWGRVLWPSPPPELPWLNGVASAKVRPPAQGSKRPVTCQYRASKPQPLHLQQGHPAPGSRRGSPEAPVVCSQPFLFPPPGSTSLTPHRCEPSARPQQMSYTPISASQRLSQEPDL